MKRLEVFGLMFLVCFVALAFNIQQVKTEPGTIYVPGNFQTIQAAIDAASAGDTVHVRAGHYFETITIAKSLTLEGDNSSTTIIDGLNNVSGVVVSILASNVKFTGFTVQNARMKPHYGIEVASNLDGVSISGNIILYNDYGIYCDYRCSGIIISENEVRDNGYGIYAYEATVDEITGNNISASGLSNTYTLGIELSYSSNSKISGNTLVDVATGVEIYASDTITISDNTMDNGSFSSYWSNGIYIYASSSQPCENDYITNNTIRNYDNGINFWCYSDQYFPISNNNFASNTFYSCGYAVYLQSSAIAKDKITLNDFSSNLIVSCSSFVYSENCSGNYFDHNDILSVSSVIPCTEKGGANEYSGNYWDRYSGTDSDGNGYGDTPYVVTTNSSDLNPHDTPWGPVVVTYKSVQYRVAINGNTVVSNIVFNGATNCTEFSAVLPSNLTGQWIVTLPRSLQDGQFKVLVDNNPVPVLLSWNETQTSINFTCAGSASKINRKTQVMSSLILPSDQTSPILTAIQWADVNGDGVVNIIDIALVARYFGKTCPPHPTS